MPMMFGQGANGVLEGTSPSPTYGAGDGVMIAGDVRTLARQYCAAGVKVSYTQYDALSHFTSAPVWIAQAVPWLMARVAGVPASVQLRLDRARQPADAHRLTRSGSNWSSNPANYSPIGADAPC